MWFGGGVNCWPMDTNILILCRSCSVVGSGAQPCDYYSLHIRYLRRVQPTEDLPNNTLLSDISFHLLYQSLAEKAQNRKPVTEPVPRAQGMTVLTPLILSRVESKLRIMRVRTR